MASVFSSCSNLYHPNGFSLTSGVLSDPSLRKAMIKNRFAETILRGQDKMIQSSLLDKETQERKKAEVEAGIREAQLKLNEQRQKDRQLAREAIGKIVQTVECNHPLELAHELDKLIVLPTFLHALEFENPNCCYPDYSEGYQDCWKLALGNSRWRL